MVLELCESSLAYCPVPPHEDDYCTTYLLFSDGPCPNPYIKSQFPSSLSFMNLNTYSVNLGE